MHSLDLLEADARRALRGVDCDRLSAADVLITGGSGLIGTHLCFCLNAAGRRNAKAPRVVVATGRGVAQWLRAIEDPGKLDLLPGDLTDPDFVSSLPSADVIIHCATYGQPGKFLENQLGTLHLNTATTLQLLAKLRPGGSFLFMSSSEVYSGLTRVPFAENAIGTTQPDHPRAAYIEGKRCGEAICAAARARGVQARSVRLCLAYGPGTRAGDQRILSELVSRGVSQGEVWLRDHGSALRAYCYVADAVHMILQVLLHGRHGTYNVGGPALTSIADLAAVVADELDVPVRIPAGQDRHHSDGAPDAAAVDISLFESEFEAVDFLPLRDGVRRTIEWHRALATEVEAS